MAEIKSTPNYSARTFTIRKNGVKYRTTRMDSNEFNSNLYNTQNDWVNFLRYSQDYYIVK